MTFSSAPQPSAGPRPRLLRNPEKQLSSSQTLPASPLPSGLGLANHCSLPPLLPTLDHPAGRGMRSHFLSGSPGWPGPSSDLKDFNAVFICSFERCARGADVVTEGPAPPPVYCAPGVDQGLCSPPRLHLARTWKGPLSRPGPPAHCSTVPLSCHCPEGSPQTHRLELGCPSWHPIQPPCPHSAHFRDTMYVCGGSIIVPQYTQQPLVRGWWVGAHESV